MKKKSCAVLVAAMVILTGCNANPGTSQSSAGENSSSSANTSSEAPAQSSSESPAQSSSEAPVQSSSGESSTSSSAKNPPEIVPETSDVQLLDIDKYVRYHDEWTEDFETMMFMGDSTSVLLGKNASKLYPELAVKLHEDKDLVLNSFEEGVTYGCELALEELENNPDDFNCYSNSYNELIRRADSVAVSILSDNYNDATGFGPFKGFTARNFDTETGKMLQITDVIKDFSGIPEIIKTELESGIVGVEAYSAEEIADYFNNVYEDYLVWSIDYNGVTFYFDYGVIAPSDYGLLSVTVTFAEHPEIFVEKYMNVPENYIVNFPMYSIYSTDLTGDGDCEELCVSYDGYQCEIYMTDSYFSDELSALYAYPFYVKNDGKHYLYLFLDNSDEEYREMKLAVYGLNGGKIEKIGEPNVGMYYEPTGNKPDDLLSVPTDPNEFFLDDFDDETRNYSFDGIYDAGGPVAYKVDDTGMPVKK